MTYNATRYFLAGIFVTPIMLVAALYTMQLL